MRKLGLAMFGCEHGRDARRRAVEYAEAVLADQPIAYRRFSVGALVQHRQIALSP